ncbi:MAG: chromate resistance protein [Rhodocyclales bacterium GWA2_65_20]|nr:MAG: chromate resistance protein [Rhodocyclales bacterium GWA2_65_20]
MDFLALFVSLPTRQSAGRMRIWRALRALGCATLRDGVYLLPDSPEHAAALEQIAENVRAVQGTADLFRLAGRDAVQQAAVVALFDRGADYARLLQAIRAALAAAEPRTAHALRREFKAIAAIDHFPGEAQQQVAAVLAELAAVAGGEPRAEDGKVRRLTSADYSGRTWATRKNLWVDRMASAWLIRRFIDRQAKFLWLDNPKKCPKSALGFDFDGAAFTHVGGRVTFEVLAASFGLDSDPALVRIAAIVHCLDVGGVPVAEAPGIEAVLAGARAAAPSDDKLLTEASRVLDNLYKSYKQESAHE